MAFNHIDMLSILIHHGVKGQKWGERNGPPYPLTASAKAGASRNKNNSKAGGESDSASSGKKVAGLELMAIELVAIPVISAAIMKIRKNLQAKKAVGKTNADHLQERREGEEIDPETGLYLRNDNASPQEDMANVNPNYNMAEAFQVNCTKCTAAMEMRCRGYDVAAGKMGNDGDKHVVGLDADVFRKWFGDEQNPGAAVDILRSGKKSKEYIKAITDEIKKGGEGARGELLCMWANGSGHSMFYIVEKGEAVIYDAQTNQRIAERDMYAKRLGGSGAASIRRLDNLTANVERMKQDNTIN